MYFNYNHLYYFYRVAALGGISPAAAELRISQPSLSAQIKTFEGYLDKKLFEKSGRKIRLTQEGDKIFSYCLRMFEISNELESILIGKKVVKSEKFKIGISEQVERPFIADVLSPLIKSQKHRDYHFLVLSEVDSKMLQDLNSKVIDLFITNRPVFNDAIYELIKIEMPVKLFLNKSLLTTKSNLDKIFNQTGIILPSEEQKLRHETDSFLQSKKIQANISLESDAISVIARAILDGAGAGFLPAPYMKTEIKIGNVVAIGPKEGFWRHHIHVYTRKDLEQNPKIEDFKKVITKYTF